MDSITIPRRFNGPPDSGNGGYSCGRLAAFVEGPARVRLLRPPPLATAMAVVRDEAGVTLRDGAADVARAVPATLELAVPDWPAAAEVSRCEQRYRGHTEHGFPGCFVCGPKRAAGDGLRLFAGPRDERTDHVATHWTPDPSLATTEGRIDPVFVWAALDCPGAFSFTPAAGRFIVLGEMAAAIDADVVVGETLRVIGWHLASDGRKHDTGTAIIRDDDSIVARAKARWFEVDPSAFKAPN